MQDKEGAIWVGTLGGGVSRLDTNSWMAYTQKEGLSTDKVNTILQDEAGTIWFGTIGGGVSRLDGQNWQTYTYTQQDGLRSNVVSVIRQDKGYPTRQRRCNLVWNRVSGRPG